jgi:glycerophosphoryl diester phosphodiesterase
MLDVNSPFLVIGHRGCAGIEPENTLLAVRRALELGCQIVEVDVHLVGGELAVIHDSTVNRTTNGLGSVSSFSLEELRRLDAGKGERIPLLSDVLDICEGKVGVNVEIKGKGCARALAKMLESRADVIVSSFDWGQLEEFACLSPEIDVAVLVDKKSKIDAAFRLAQKLEAIAVNPSVRVLSGSLVERAHEAGMKVYSYTVRSQRDLNHVLESGADGCFADDPAMVLNQV